MDTTKPNTVYDAIVVGGSYAGISAAMQLARARRRVLVIDAGQRRNVGSSRVDLQACKLEYSIVSPK